MEKKNKKGRIIKILSKKNDCMVVIHSREAKRYAIFLEDNPEVLKYETLIELDKHNYQHLSTLDIRKDYFCTEWVSDFLIYYANGEKEIREIVSSDLLFKQSTAEKLEFSRRYWMNSNLHNWKIVVMEEKNINVL